MIYLHTGQPGAGKTLFTLAHVKTEAEKDGRQVYYNGIPELKVPGWIELEDATKWHELPAGAVVVIDEAQRVFRPRGTGSAVPEHVAKLETHRHQGLDLYIITQHPMLIDSNVRRLTGTHRHVVRAFGAKYATIHEWGEVKEQCDKSRADSIAKRFLYPKEVFGWYKSAEAHTHKARIPARVYLLFALPILLGLVVWWGSTWFANREQALKEKIHGGVTVTETQGESMPARAPAQPQLTWFEEQAPRVPGLAHTAPKYDQITKPTTAPIPAACVEWEGKGCRCYSQQGTRLDVPSELCTSIVQRGYFVEFDASGQTGRQADGTAEPARRPTRPPEPAPLAYAPAS